MSNEPMFRDGMFTDWKQEEAWRDRNSNGDEAKKIIGTGTWDMELREWAKRWSTAPKVQP